MSCCGNHNHDGNHHADGKHSGQSKKHNWMMILCCVLPIVLFAAILLFNGLTSSTGNIFPFLLLLICPLSHFLLMPMMSKKRH
ncbi:DUF2933 domain-containing protein [Paenibacillus timonensis]|uniref:DUF2933 domain-containing protein n=1 Tax=Paenibacillus timonensis TaxID=225915 RepID=UPI003F9A3D1A